MRTFSTGATRDDEGGKLDYDGFLSPLVLDRYAQYMHEHRRQKDGQLRDSDNWQKGIPTSAYMKSLWRHFMDVWRQHHGLPGEDTMESSLMAVLFNVMGYAHETLRTRYGAEQSGIPQNTCGDCEHFLGVPFAGGTDTCCENGVAADEPCNPQCFVPKGGS